MISSRSVQNFFVVNGSVLIVGTTFYLIERLNPMLVLFLMLVKNYLTLAGIRPRNTRQPLPLAEFFKSTCIDTLSYCIISRNFTHPTISFQQDLIMLLPVSFAYELVFDFFYYWSHRALHSPIIFKATHATHHTHGVTTVYTTFHHSLADLLMTNTLPLVLTSMLVPVSAYTFTLIFCYKNIAEIAGHSGVNKRTPSFVQCIWLPKALGIELYTRNHCLHHENPRVNFSKRFSIWDKVFGTFDPRIPKQMIKQDGQVSGFTEWYTNFNRLQLSPFIIYFSSWPDWDKKIWTAHIWLAWITNVVSL